MPDLRDLDERFSSLAAHRTLLAIRNAYLSILPYVIVMAALTVAANLFHFAGIDSGMAYYISQLARYLGELFPEVILLSLSWSLNSHHRVRAPAVMLVSLPVFWILCGWDQLGTEAGPQSRSLGATIAIYPTLLLTHVMFKLFGRDGSDSSAGKVVMSQLITFNLRYVLPGVLCVLLAILLRLAFVTLSDRFAPGIHAALVDRIPYGVEVILFVMFLQVLSLFAIHGYATMLGVYEYLHHKSALLGLPSPEFFTLYATPGGAGSVFCLMLVMLVVSSRREYKALARISAPLTLFNISETLVFGIPLVFNLRMAWAFIAVPTVNAVIAYTAMAAGWVEPHPNSVHWAVPYLISSYLAFDGLYLPSILLQLTCIACGVAIYTVAWRRYVYREHSSQDDYPVFPSRKASDSAFGDDALDIVLMEENVSRWSRVKQADRTLKWLSEGELELVFQPVVDASTSRIRHVEALLRYRDAQGRLHAPLFLDVLRHHPGVMEGIECWVIREACQHALRWHEQGVNKRLFINVTPLFFTSDNVRRCFYTALNEVPVNALGIEITEQSLLTDLPQTLSDIHLFQSMDVQFALDDFGSGYSSFNYLSQLTVDFVKLDKTLIEHIHHPRQASIVASIYQLCQTLRLQVICEGVDDQRKQAFLATLGVPLVQGFLLYRPMEAAAMEALLREEHHREGPTS
ncbi:EAL domain-containing protein [Halomonas denitrificans]|uniref:EAL domain-containing protein n=1 Tax=Halomonas denitrificans TaxID=370769 RepID=UPI001C99FFC3|nr:EAL domain-containing protein [Halomonas denitrificans]MBY5967389.1 EAL domain-containing protein [Halomonas denitrificans]